MPLLKTFLSHNDRTYNLYYLGRYLPFSAGSDPFSHSLLKFKQGLRPDLDAWIGQALEALQEIPPAPGTLIFRALHHNETQAGSSPLDLLGQAIATHFDCRYLPTLLRKTHPAQSNKTLDLAERQAQLQNLYRLVPQPELTPHTPLLLIDDILTTGTTIRSIIDALPPNSFQIFTLAIADGDKYPSPRPTP